MNTEVVATVEMGTVRLTYLTLDLKRVETQLGLKTQDKSQYLFCGILHSFFLWHMKIKETLATTLAITEICDIIWL